MGASRWFFTLSGSDPADRRDRPGDQAAQLRHRLQVRHADRRWRWSSRPTRKASAKPSNESASTTPRSSRSPTRTSATTSSRSRRAELGPSQVKDAKKRCSHSKFGIVKNGFESTSVGPTFGEQVASSRRQGADLLAAGDLRLRGASLRAEVRGPGADRALPRHPDHGGHLRADRERSEQRDGRRLPDHLGLLALRHDHRLRPNTREHAANAASGVLADRQPLDERGADPLAGDQLHDPAGGRLAAGLRRRDAAGLRLRDAGRDRLRHLLVDLHRLAGADRLEGTRAAASPAGASRIAEVEGRVPAFADDDRAGEARPTTTRPKRASRSRRRLPSAKEEPKAGAVATAERPRGDGRAGAAPAANRRAAAGAPPIRWRPSAASENEARRARRQQRRKHGRTMSEVR